MLTKLTQAITKQFNSQDILFLEDPKGELWLTGETIGKALGYKNPRISINTIYNRNKALLKDFTTVINLITVTGPKDTTVFNEMGCNIIAMKSDTPLADQFVIWAAGIIKEYRHGNLTRQPKLTAPFLRELKKTLDPLSVNAYLHKTLKITRPPYIIVQKALETMRISVYSFMQEYGYRLDSKFYQDLNTGDFVKKEHLARRCGLQVSDIWKD